MGQILVRNLEDNVIERLKARALKTDKSLEQSVRDILIEAAKPSREEVWAEIDRLRELLVPSLWMLRISSVKTGTAADVRHRC